MIYDVIPKEKLGLRKLLQQGDGTFEVLTAEDTISKKERNPMIKLKLRVWDNLGETDILFSYLVAKETAIFKIFEFCAATGLDYSKGELDVNLIKGKRGKCILKTEMSDGYDDKTGVASFTPIGKPTSEAPGSAEIEEAFKDDAIPF